MRLLLLVLSVWSLWAPIERLDAQVQQWAQAWRAESRGGLERPMQFVTDLGKPAVVLGALLGVAVLDAAEGVAVARVALVTLGAVNLAVEGIKRATGRTRPDGESKRSNSSFPSSHAANAFALAVLFARRWRRGAWAFWALATLVAVSRVYLNRHYASDVLAAAVLGVGLALWVARRMQWRVARAASRGPKGGAGIGSLNDSSKSAVEPRATI